MKHNALIAEGGFGSARPPATVPKRRRTAAWITAGATCAVIALLWIARARVLDLPLPCPQQGCVVDAETGKPIPGARLEYHWQVYDYPMLDGAGSRTVTGSTATDASGRFTLSIPNVRRGLFKTEAYPPIVRANGYLAFTLSDWGRRERYGKDGVTIPMEPDPDNGRQGK